MRHASDGARVIAGVVRFLLGTLLFAAVIVAIGFMVLPIVAIFTHVPPGELIDQLSNPVVHDALIVTLKTTLVAQGLILLFGTPTAYVLATRRFPGRSVVITFVELPIVLPPAVAGIGLLVAFGRFGLLGESIGGWLAFTWVAVVCAIMLVAGPFYVRQAIAAFETVDPNLVSASRTLGAGPVRTFFRVTLPLARGGLVAGEAVALARGLGEFGATIMFAGSLQGRTQTLPLAIYQQFAAINGFNVALAISALLVIVSLAILLSLKLSGLWARTRPAVPVLAGPNDLERTAGG
ncbi:MAG TPA: ABC transporter permease [Gaiellaceae bacterium]